MGLVRGTHSSSPRVLPQSVAVSEDGGSHLVRRMALLEEMHVEHHTGQKQVFELMGGLQEQMRVIIQQLSDLAKSEVEPTPRSGTSTARTRTHDARVAEFLPSSQATPVPGSLRETQPQPILAAEIKEVKDMQVVAGKRLAVLEELVRLELSSRVPASQRSPRCQAQLATVAVLKRVFSPRPQSAGPPQPAPQPVPVQYQALGPSLTPRHACSSPGSRSTGPPPVVGQAHYLRRHAPTPTADSCKQRVRRSCSPNRTFAEVPATGGITTPGGARHALNLSSSHARLRPSALGTPLACKAASL